MPTAPEDAVKNGLQLLVLLGSVGTMAADPVKQQPITIRPDDLEWEKPFGPRGMSLAFLMGRLGNQKPASYFIRFPAGYKTGWHTHTNEYQAVVLKGAFTAQEQGDEERQLPAGSFLMQR